MSWYFTGTSIQDLGSVGASACRILRNFCLILRIAVFPYAQDTQLMK